MRDTFEKLSTLKCAHLVQILENEFNFKCNNFYYNSIVQKKLNYYNKVTLIKIILLFEQYNIKVNYKVTQCALTKSEIAQKFKVQFNINFTPHEINYISREEFIILYNNIFESDIYN